MKFTIEEFKLWATEQTKNKEASIKLLQKIGVYDANNKITKKYGG